VEVRGFLLSGCRSELLVPAHVSLGAHVRSYGDGYASTATETTANARERSFRAGRFQERIL